jgi:carbonic anhydrase
MSLVTRRKFAAMMGLATAGGVLRSGWAQTHGAEQAALKGHAPAATALKAVGNDAVAPATKVDRSIASPEDIWNDLMEGNKRFTSGKTAPRDVVGGRVKTANSQHPYVMVLCCADSRLSPELIFDQTIGDLFVVRAAGNIADPIGLGSLEYAVEHLGSRMLVVLGHEKCGAVAATLSGEAMPTDNLTALVDKIKPGIERLKGLVQGDTLMSLAVEANVHHSASNVIEGSPIVRHEVATGELTVVKAVYKLGSDEVIRLGSFE